MKYGYLKEERVSAFHCTKLYRVLKKEGKEVYKCKLGNELILKRRGKRIPHFAHKPGSDCIELKWSEPETDAHYFMKIWLQGFLDVPDKMVEYDKIQGVRPDLLWKKKIAIEIQHSMISVSEYKRRNSIYFEHGLTPLWIFHKKELIELEPKNLNGKFGKIWGREKKIFRLKDIEQYLYNNHERILYYSFPDSSFFEKSILMKEKMTSLFNQSRECAPRLEIVNYINENDATLFSISDSEEIDSAENLEFHAKYRLLKKKCEFLEYREFLQYNNLYAIYFNNCKIKFEDCKKGNFINNPYLKEPQVKVYNYHIISLELYSEIYAPQIINLECFQNIQSLKLNHMGLTKIPEIIIRLQDLQNLDISHNDIHQID